MTAVEDDRDPFSDSDDDIYRLSAPEPLPESQPAPQVPVSHVPDQSPFFEDEPAKTPTKKKRKRRKPDADGGDSTKDKDGKDKEENPWVADSGWRDRQLISALWYPLTGSGWYLIPIYSVLLGMSIIPVVGGIFGLLGMLLVSLMCLVTANYTLEGIPAGPQPPDLLSWDSIVSALMGLVAFMISGIPTLLGLLVTLKLQIESPIMTLVLAALGFFYAPMAFLALASEQNDGALNPLAVFRGIRNMLVPYVFLWGFAAVAFVVVVSVVAFTAPAAFFPAMGCALVYAAVALLRAVALVARRVELTFD